MEEIRLESALENWSIGERSNLGTLLSLKPGEDPSLENIIRQFKWLYHSRARAKAETLFKNELSSYTKILLGGEKPKIIKEEDIRESPSYSYLIRHASVHLGVFNGNPSLEECELFISHAVIVEALTKMTPKQRVLFFTSQVELCQLPSKMAIKTDTLAGPLTAVTALGLAQASGFGIYLASTTALGFLTHAVGITLPFAVYTTMTSTIAFIIGPVGWLSVGLWGAWKITGPDWKKLIPALIYIIATNSKNMATLNKELHSIED